MFRLALSFLTILPGGRLGKLDKEDFASSVKYFPIVGLILGLIVAGIYSLVSLKLAQQASSAIAIVSLIALTRALHIDGLADTLDGLFGGKDKEHTLSIMKDSRVGSFGTVAVSSIIVLKIFLLSSIAVALKLKAIIIFPVVGRWVATYALATQPYARDEPGLGSLFMGESGGRSLIISSLITIVITAALLRINAAVVMVVALALAILYIRFVNVKLGGMTGDTVGALIELTETVALLTIAVI